MLRILDNILAVNISKIGNLKSNISNKFLGFLDKISESIQVDEFQYSGQHLGVTVGTISNTMQTELAATLSPSGRIGVTVNHNLTAKEKEVINNTQILASIKLPKTAIFTSSNKSLKIISTVFRKCTFFNTASPRQQHSSSSQQQRHRKESKNIKTMVIGSIVMSASVKNYVIENLADPVQLDFKVANQNSVESINRLDGRCVFWEPGKT